MSKMMLAVVAMSASLSLAAVNGVVKDDKGNPVSGALVVAEGTDQGAITDANGRFQLSSANASVSSVIKQRLTTSHLRVDAQGKYFREKSDPSHKVYFLTRESTTKNSNPKSQTKDAVLTKKTAATDANLLISHAGHFGEVTAIDASSSEPLTLSMNLISEFAKSSEVTRFSGDIKVLAFTDSTIEGVDTSTKEFPVCQGGVVTYLPDTSTLNYKIAGKTMYLWDPQDTDSLGTITTLLTSGTGTKMGTWNVSGLGDVPDLLPAGSPGQAEMDSMLELQRSYFKVSGTTSFSTSKIHNDMEYGICMGPLIANSWAYDLITATAKSCTEAVLKNGNETATWTFNTTNSKTTQTFTYKDTACVMESTGYADPVYSCVGKPDGYIPTDTSSFDADTNSSDISSCPAYIDFWLGGLDIPEIPLLKKASRSLPNPISLERRARVGWIKR